jgi:hypothetical protein
MLRKKSKWREAMGRRKGANGRKYRNLKNA